MSNKMYTYTFATCRGEDFEIEGNSPLDAYRNLLRREDGEGTIWRMNDIHRNRYAVEKQGFKPLFDNDLVGGVYKVKTERTAAEEGIRKAIKEGDKELLNFYLSMLEGRHAVKYVLEYMRDNQPNAAYVLDLVK